MGTITIRVVPRSGRRVVEVGDGRVVVRVRAAAADGRATEEARRALAEAIGVPVYAIRLRTGARSRTKLFDVDDLTSQEVESRLAGT